MEFLTDILAYNYLSNAVIACILSGITCGIIGTYIVARRMVFLCGGITHASFGGLGIAFYLNINPLWGALVFAILSSPFLSVKRSWLSSVTMIIAIPTAIAFPIIIGIVAPLTNSNA